MSSEDIERLWAANHARTCAGKARFSDEATASRAYFKQLPSRIVYRSPNRKRPERQLKEQKSLCLYICKHCSYIHIGHHGPTVNKLKTQENAALK